MVNWKEYGNPFLDFTEEITQKWINERFNQVQCKEWLDIGAEATEADFCAWLRDEKSKDIDDFAEPQWVKDNVNLKELKREGYGEYLREKVSPSPAEKESLERLERERERDLVKETEEVEEPEISGEEIEIEGSEEESEKGSIPFDDNALFKPAESTYKRWCEEKDGVIGDLKRDIADLKAERFDFSQRIGAFEEEITSLQNGRELYESQISQAQDEINKLNNQKNSLEASINQQKNAIKSLENKNSNLNIKLEEKQAIVAEKEFTITNLLNEKGQELKEQKEAFQKESEKEKNKLLNNISELTREKTNLFREKNSAQRWKKGLGVFSVISCLIILVMLFSKEQSELPKTKVRKKKQKIISVNQ